MHFIEIADLYLNLDHVAFIREEEHSQLGNVLAIHFTTADASPLYISTRHYDELRPLVLERKRVKETS
jgi:hypothetical protein